VYLFLLEQFFHQLSRCYAFKCEWPVKVFNNFVENHVEMERLTIENPYQANRKSSLHNFRAIEHTKNIFADRATRFYKRNNDCGGYA
jgi:hypothetical protein